MDRGYAAIPGWRVGNELTRQRPDRAQDGCITPKSDYTFYRCNYPYVRLDGIQDTWQCAGRAWGHDAVWLGADLRRIMTSSLTRRSCLKGLAAAAITGAVGARFTTSAAADTLPPVSLVPARMADSLAASYGINTHLSFRPTVYGNTSAVVEFLKWSRARMIRDRIVPGNKAQLQAFAELAAAGCRTHSTMGKFGETDQSVMNSLVAAAATMPEAFVSFGGPNEPNASGRPSDWASRTVAHQKLIWSTVRGNSALSSVPICGPALQDVSPTLHQDFAALGSAGVAKYCDYGDFHSYPGGWTPSEELDLRISWARAAFGNKLDYCTEGGYNNGMSITNRGNPVPEDVAGIYAPRQLLEHFIRGNTFFAYELLDDPDPSGSDWEAHFGLIGTPSLDPATWYAKPALSAMRRLIHHVADPGPEFIPDPLSMAISGGGVDMRSTLLAKRNGTHQLLMWRDVNVYDPKARSYKNLNIARITVTLAKPAVVDLFRPSTPGISRESLGVVTSFSVPLGPEMYICRMRHDLNATN
jgi:hypothetical protein